MDSNLPDLDDQVDTKPGSRSDQEVSESNSSSSKPGKKLLWLMALAILMAVMLILSVALYIGFSGNSDALDPESNGPPKETSVNASEQILTAPALPVMVGQSSTALGTGESLTDDHGGGSSSHIKKVDRTVSPIGVADAHHDLRDLIDEVESLSAMIQDNARLINLMMGRTEEAISELHRDNSKLSESQSLLASNIASIVKSIRPNERRGVSKRKVKSDHPKFRTLSIRVFGDSSYVVVSKNGNRRPFYVNEVIDGWKLVEISKNYDYAVYVRDSDKKKFREQI